MADFLDEYFSTRRMIPIVVDDLGPVGEDLMQYFRIQEYTVSGVRLPSGGWYISMHKGDWFRAILGLKTALNITIDRVAGGTFVKAGIGIFELQVLPTIITVFVFAPVILAQIWGIIQQEKLDEEAVRYVEDRLGFYGGTYGAPPTYGTPPVVEDTARSAAEAELNG